LCEKKETKSETPEKRQAREKIFSQQFQAKAKNYLRELRRQAMIERKSDVTDGAAEQSKPPRPVVRRER